MASQKLDLQIRGLYTSQNNLSGVPPGALAVAQNLVIDSKSIASSRRGQSQFGAAMSIGSGQVTKLFNYSQGMIARYDNKLAFRTQMAEHSAAAWSDYSGTYLDPESGYKVRSLEALRNFYFTTALGVYKLDSIESTPRISGVVQALGGTAALTGVTGFLADDSAIRYRLIWGYRDVNNNLVRGAPSQPLIVRNSSGNDADVNSTWVIPDSITTEYFYQLYRSKNTATAADEPSEELQLVAEGNPTSGEIAAGVFTINDVTPESLMGETLYTSPSQQGIENANDVPPKCNDMDVYKGCAFYVNTTGYQQLTTTIISVDSPSLGYVVDATVDTVNGDATLTSITSTANLRVGMRVVGTGIPAGTTILSITNSTTLEMSANATATGTVSIEFQDRFSIYTDDFWAGSAENAATKTFLVETGGTPATNIEDTALSLVQIINTASEFGLAYAFYLSGTEDLPGQILLREREYTGFAFDITSTAGGSFSPAIPDAVYIQSNTVANPTVVTTKTAHGLSTGNIVGLLNTPLSGLVGSTAEITVISPTTFSIDVEATVNYGALGYVVVDDLQVVSAADRNQNYAFVSKPGEVEAVPRFRFFPIGSANFPIERVVALRDGIFFFKEDGIYRISGESFENFTVALLDNTVKLKARESAVPFNNQIFCFTDQGVCAVSDSGVQIMSVPIENLFNVISSDDYPNFSTATFGVAYESARQYMLFTVSDPADTFATEGWVYNSLTDAWTGPWPMSRTCGVVATVEDKLVMAEADTGQCLMERKSFTLEDFADKQFAVTISSVNTATTMTLASVTNVTEGMTIVQGSRRQYIEEINGNVLTVSSTNGFSAAAATVYQPIENEIEFVPIDAENPGLLKQFSEVSVFFRNAAFREIDAIFSSNISSGQITVPLQSVASSGWGQFGWGQAPWGSPIGGQNVLRTYIPRNAQRAHWLNMRLRTNEAFTGFSLQGMSIIYNTMSPRFR